MNNRLIEILFLLNNWKINTSIIFRTHNLGAAKYILKCQNWFLWSYLALKIEKIEKFWKNWKKRQICTVFAIFDVIKT